MTETQRILDKEVFTVKDIEEIFQVKRTTAYKIMKEIKAVSDRLELAGRVHKKDYEDYLNRKSK